MRAARSAAVLAGLWAGMLAGIALIAAPAAFAKLAPAAAGQVVGRMFEQEARLSLGVALLLIFHERWRSRGEAGGSRALVLSVNLLLLFGTLFCTVAGHFALQPMLAAARAGSAPWSFGTLHKASLGFFVLKSLLVLSLAWRLSRR